MKIRISGFWANGVARSTRNQKLSPFGNVLQPVGFYDPIFGVIGEVRRFMFYLFCLLSLFYECLGFIYTL